MWGLNLLCMYNSWVNVKKVSSNEDLMGSLGGDGAIGNRTDLSFLGALKWSMIILGL